jgi:hypothetical protein
MRLLFVMLFSFAVALGLEFSVYASVAIAISVYFAVDFFFKVNEKIAFVEFLLAIYGLNYLFSPALAYKGIQDEEAYGMRIPEAEYFGIAIYAVLILWLGLSLIPIRIFKINIEDLKKSIEPNIKVIRYVVVWGMVLAFVGNLVRGELSTLLYIVALLRYVAAMCLFVYDSRENKWYIIAIIIAEITGAIFTAMFHDAVIWLIFFALVIMYKNKPHYIYRLGVCVLGIFTYVVLQSSKADYRMSYEKEERDFSKFFAVIERNFSGEDKQLFSQENNVNSVNRVNQAWIFASTMQNMDYTRDFQGGKLMSKYFEAAFLPRFLAPNKLKAGDRTVFNKYSGHYIHKNTSMGLGIFADGYVSFGYFGTIIFALLFGVVIKLVCRVIEYWSRKSLMFIFLVFPILFYAVRPDCETQTLFGHILKAIVAYGLLIFLFKSVLVLEERAKEEDTREGDLIFSTMDH